MRKILRRSTILICFLYFSGNILAQSTSVNVADLDMKEKIYESLKPKVNRFTKKDFDDLFFEFFQKRTSENIILTKEEYYTYTISIAIYSAKLGLLYKDEKATAEKTKQEWFNKNYEEYYNSKNK